MRKQHSQLCRLTVGHQWSNQGRLVVLGTVNLQLQGQFSLVIRRLTSPAIVGFSLFNHSQDKAQNITYSP